MSLLTTVTGLVVKRSARLSAFGCRTSAAMTDAQRPSRDERSLQFLTLQDLEGSELTTQHGRLDKFSTRLDSGLVCAGFLQDSQVVAYIWFANPVLTSTEYAPWAVGAKLRVPSSTVYIFDCRTHPDFTGRGLYSAALTACMRMARDKDVPFAAMECAPHNVPSVRGMRNAGFRHQGNLTVSRIGPLIQVQRDLLTSQGKTDGATGRWLGFGSVPSTFVHAMSRRCVDGQSATSPSAQKITAQDERS
ncbi:MAG: GNAT family N-acetyltransferase [Pseudomonadota bacterium]